MNRTLLFRWIFAISSTVVLVSGALIMYRLPSTMTFAVGPQNSPLTSYAREINEALAAARSSYRFKIIPTKGSAESAQMLEASKVRLALLRSDDETSQTARSLMILQRKTLFAIARKPKDRANLPVAPPVVNPATIAKNQAG